MHITTKGIYNRIGIYKKNWKHPRVWAIVKKQLPVFASGSLLNNPLNFLLEIIQQHSLHLQQKLLNIMNTLWILRWTKLSYRKPHPLKSITMITRDRWVLYTEKNARSYDLKKNLNGGCTVVVCFLLASSSQMKYFDKRRK